MNSINIKQFHDQLQDYIDQVLDQHQPLKVLGDSGADFIVISAEDWEQAQETIYVLQNSDLMKQIAKSFTTHINSQGYHPSTQEIDEILSI